MTSATKRVLFVSYLFPPTGGVGVHRVTKFIKYLPQFGWDSSVLTVSNPSVPLQDDSLCRDVPAGTLVRRAKTWEPGYAVKNAVSASATGNRRTYPLTASVKHMARKAVGAMLQPDAQILWRHHALREGRRLLHEVPHDVIIATGPPFSSLLVGATLSRRSGVPLVLDYRDEWDISNSYWENKRPGRLTNWLQQQMQASALRAAHTVVATTPSSTQAVLDLAHRADCDPEGVYLLNGYDPDDYAEVNHRAMERTDYGNGVDRYRLSFVGTLWKLNSIEHVVAGLERLAERAPHLADEIELVCAGRKTAEEDALLDRLEALPCRLVRLSFVAHDQAIRLMRTADALLMLLNDLPGTHRIISAKTYEYMAARKPTFLVAPPGDVERLLSEVPGTVACRPNDPSGIADALAMEVERHRLGINHDDADWELSQFERRTLTRQLAETLDGIVQPRTTTSEPKPKIHRFAASP